MEDRNKRELSIGRSRIDELEGKSIRLREELKFNLYSPPSDSELTSSDTSQMQLEEIQNKSSDLLKDQDRQLDAILGYAANLKRQNVEIHEEVQDQNQALDSLGGKIEKTGNHMVKTQNKMDKLLQKTSNSCLYFTLCLEVFLLILLVVL